MIDHNVIFGGRQVGKTYTIMHEMHDLIVAGRQSEILVVFPAISYLHWWTRAWQGLFPHVPMPRYVTINNTLKLRGLRLGKIYVEDIDAYDDGIYDSRLRDVYPCLLSPFHDEEIIFTCSPNPLAQKSHNVETSKREILEALDKRRRDLAAAKKFKDDMMIAHMLAYTQRGLT